MRTAKLLFLCSVLCLGNGLWHQATAHESVREAQAKTPAWAGRITADNAPDLVMGGPNAIGGIGDWYVSNGEICAIVSDIGHETEISPTGGVLVDLGFCGRDDDQFLYYHELLNFQISGTFIAEEISAKIEGGAARIIVKGRRDNAASKTVYQLDKETPGRIKITGEYYRTSEGGEDIFGVGNLVTTLRSLKQFDLSTDNAVRSRGFVHHTRQGGTSTIAKASSPSDAMIYVGKGIPGRNIVYGQRVLSARRVTAKGRTYELPRYFISDNISSFLSIFSDSYYLGNRLKPGLFTLIQTRLFDLKMGDRLIVEHEIRLARGSDVAGITDQFYADEPLLRGSAGEPGAVVHINRADGSALTQVTAGDDGGFVIHAPPGDYQVLARGLGGRSAERNVTVTAKGVDVGEMSLGPKAVISLPQGQTMRLTFVGEGDTDDPNFDDDLLGYTLIDKDTGPRSAKVVLDINLAGLESDPSEIVLAPGKYRVYSCRGPEYSLGSTTVDAVPGKTLTLDIEFPKHIVSTPGWISADLHVHSGASFDNGTPIDDRLVSYMAQGGEVLVSSEHDNIYDFTPDIQRLDLADRLAYVVGLEITSEQKSELAPYTIGHANAFPLLSQPYAYRNGAVPHESRRWRDVIGDLRQSPAQPVIQLNHARFDLEYMNKFTVNEQQAGIEPRAFFSHMGPAAKRFDPHIPLTSGANAVLVEPDPETGIRDIDFDAIELLNGPHLSSYHRLRVDWFTLLRQGECMTGVANSDSHTLETEHIVLSPRSMVFLEDDTVGGFSEGLFIRAIREGRLYGTSGPLFSKVSLDGAGIGDTHAGKEGALTVVIEAAPWVDVRLVRVFDNGLKVHEGPIEAGAAFELPMKFERDTFVTVEVEGEAGEDYSKILPGNVPFAFTNPIYVDADGDGKWTPIGTPVPKT
jgi:hypothetical protein